MSVPSDKAFSLEMLNELLKVQEFKPNPLLYSAAPIDGMRVLISDLCPPGKTYFVDDAIIKPSYAMTYTMKPLDYLEPLDIKSSLHLQAMTQKIKDTIFDENTLFSLIDGINEDPKQRAALQAPPPNACDACRGSGVFNGEECWHCGGEGDDPTK